MTAPASAADIPYAGAKYCACGNMIIRTSSRGPMPKYCAQCRVVNGQGDRKFRKQLALMAEETAPAEPSSTPAQEPEASPTVAIPDALDLIAALQLDYCVGSAARFLLEYRDGDELQNLQVARDYLDRAIKARGGV